MTGWVASGEGTYRRSVKRSRKDRRCDECLAPLPMGRPYVEHRAVMWSEFSDHAYSIRTCGERTEDCKGGSK